MSRPDADKLRLEALARLVAETAESEIDCGDALERLAELLEAVRTDQADRAELAAVAQHLRVCPECDEIFAALSRIPDDL